MLYNIEGDNITPVGTTKDRGAVGRLVEEMDGWKKYKQLHTKTGDERYSGLAYDEFKHMLVALEDTMLEIRSCPSLTEKEKAELTSFLDALKKGL